jgi:hypothetical protein
MKIYKFSFIEILRATVRQKRDLIVTFFKSKIKIDVTLLIRNFLHIVMKVALFYTLNRSESSTFLYHFIPSPWR